MHGSSCISMRGSPGTQGDSLLYRVYSSQNPFDFQFQSVLPCLALRLASHSPCPWDTSLQSLGFGSRCHVAESLFVFHFQLFMFYCSILIRQAISRLLWWQAKTFCSRYLKTNGRGFYCRNCNHSLGIFLVGRQ